MKSIRAISELGRPYLIELDAPISITELSIVYSCIITPEDPTMALPFSKALLKVDLNQAETDTISDEILGYKELVKIFGSEFALIFLQVIPLYDKNSNKLLVVEQLEGSILDLYSIIVIENKDSTQVKAEKRQAYSELEVSAEEFKNRIDDFVYICWLMDKHHQKNIPLGDPKLANMVKSDKGTIHPIDPSYLNLNAGLGKTIDPVFYTEKYMPEGAHRATSIENRYTGLTLDIYGLVCMLYELLTSISVDAELVWDDDERGKVDSIKNTLLNSPGLSSFIALILPKKDESNQDFRLAFIKLTSLMLTYFNQFNIRDLDNAFESGDFPDQLNAYYVAEKLVNALGISLEIPDDPNQAWSVNWNQDQIDAIEKA